MIENGKVTIVGSGFVGATTAYTLAMSSIVTELVLIDLNHDKAEGDALDISHGMPYLRPVKISAGNYEDSAGSEIVIITAGANQKPNETRIDLLKRNAAIFKSIISELTRYVTDETVLLVVTNPVDILTYLTYKLSGFPSGKVIGSGTVLDTSRFRYLLGQHTNVDPRNTHAYIIGEHGDSEVAVWSGATIGTMPFDEYCDQSCGRCDSMSKQEIYNEVKNSAYRIIEKKGATYYAVALAVRRIVECILRDEGSILTVSTLLKGEYGVEDVYISIPSVVSGRGVERTLEIYLSEEEREAFLRSAGLLKDLIGELEE